MDVGAAMESLSIEKEAAEKVEKPSGGAAAKFKKPKKNKKKKKNF